MRNLISIDHRPNVCNLFLQQSEPTDDWLFRNARSDFSILRQHGAIYLGHSCAGKSFVYLYPCGKFAHIVAYPANIRLFCIDSSIHFISRLLTAIFPTTNHLGTFAAWDSARFLFFFFFSPFLSVQCYLLPLLPAPRYISSVGRDWLCSNWNTKRGRYVATGIGGEGNRPRRN